MSEWLLERDVKFHILAGEINGANDYYLFFADRKQAIAFVTQFGDETHHRTWYDDAANPDDDYEGIPIGWVKTGA